MTNTQDNSTAFALSTEHARPMSRFRPDVVAMQYRLEGLLTTSATGVDEDLRRARIFDLRKQIATATAERDEQLNTVEPVADANALIQAPRHMSGKG